LALPKKKWIPLISDLSAYHLNDQGLNPLDWQVQGRGGVLEAPDLLKQLLKETAMAFSDLLSKH